MAQSAVSDTEFYTGLQHMAIFNLRQRLSKHIVSSKQRDSGGDGRRRLSKASAIWQATMVIVACLLLNIPGPAQSKPHSHSSSAGAEYSGMYAFLREGEFVQMTVEGESRVTGFVSRFGDSDSDRGVFLDHFFKSGKIDGTQLTFTTEAVHGISFEFHGVVARGEGKNPGDEAYYVLKGKLTQNMEDAGKKTSSQEQQVAFKSFPQDLSPVPRKD
jgi:hypothetical protein